MNLINKIRTVPFISNLLFWQPAFDFIKLLNQTKIGRVSIVVLNYSIWLFFVYLSFLLVLKDPNIFFQLLIATFFGEIIEKYGKSHAIWRRPFFATHRHTPAGLVESWYKTGSFPSGHTLKATFFFLFILQYGVFSPPLFLSIVLPLLAFRVIVGFHYPIDMVGGALFGSLLWSFTSGLLAPPFLNNFIRILTTYVFS